MEDMLHPQSVPPNPTPAGNHGGTQSGQNRGRQGLVAYDSIGVWLWSNSGQSPVQAGCEHPSRADPPYSALTHRAAASAESSGRVLNAILVPGPASSTALTSTSSSHRFFDGSRTPAPITTQS